MSSGEPPRSTLRGEYRIEERIGAGGFSTVWRATGSDGEPDIAVKFPAPEEAAANDESEIRTRFEREYQIFAELAGSVLPKSIPRFVVGSRSQPSYIGMELVDGVGLTTHIEDRGNAWGVDLVRAFGLPALEALEFLHVNGYHYLDFKPGNLVVRGADESPVLVDFNTAGRATEGDTTLFYEDEYKAPEQTPGDREDTAAGQRADVYAAGKLLFYLLTGRTVVTSETPSDGVNPRRAGADCSARLAAGVQSATVADPASRPVNAHALLTQLYAVLDNDPPVASLTDLASGMTCLVRPGTTVGRMTNTQPTPDVTIADSKNYISPVHFRCEYSDGWTISDTSLNGTFVRLPSERVHLLSSDGYDHLEREAPDRLPDEHYTGATVTDSAVIDPVDPDYGPRLQFET